MRQWVVVILLLCGMLCAHAGDGVVLDTIGYRYAPVLDTIVSVPVVRQHGPDNWVQQLINNRFDVNDTTLRCPRFVDFCLGLYRWGDKTFNSYDTAYVYSCPKKWKVMLKANTKWDTYHINAHEKSEPSMFYNTEPRTTAGFRLSFMAVGFEYMPDIDNLLMGKVIDHRRTRFTFTCSRIIAEAYYNKNTGVSRVNRFGDYREGRLINEKFDGLTSSTLGVDLFYVFNHRKYAHAAAYCFSKIQRRSAGSFILGLQYVDQDMTLDLSRLPDAIKPYNLWGDCVFRIHHYDYALNVGYGYNWVFRPNWLFNIMASPSVGITHSVVDNIDMPRNKFALNLRARMALVRNKGNFFYGLHTSFNGFLLLSKNISVYNMNNDVTAIAGFRFDFTKPKKVK